MVALLELTDGEDTTITLINEEKGIHLFEWRPRLTDFEPVYQDSPLANERKVIHTRLSTVTETIEYKANATTQDQLIVILQDLRRLLLKGLDFWLTNEYPSPVYLVARAACESNIRYADIRFWQTPEDDNPYRAPFLYASPEAVAMNNLTLILERAQWLANPPATSVAISAFSRQTYDSRLLGRGPTTTSEVFLSNRSTVANLTNVYRFDASAGTFSSNLMDSSLPFNLLPSGVAAGDIIYFGSRTALTDNGPITNLIFDVGTTSTNITGAVWEIWNGAAWVSNNVVDGTDDFTVSGVNGVFFTSSTQSTTINGVAAFWVRYRITSVGGAVTIPTQRNRLLYSATTPYAQVEQTEVLGDLFALGRIKLRTRSAADYDALEPGPQSDTTKVVFGLRSVSKGANFTSFLNYASKQNPSGLTVSLNVAASYTTTGAAPAGQAVTITPASPSGFTEVCEMTFDAALADHYRGTFHAYIRMNRFNGTASDIQVRLAVVSGSGGLPYHTPPAVVNTTLNYHVADLGRIIIPAASQLRPDEVPDEVTLRTEISVAATGAQLTFYDLVLIPVDELASDPEDFTGESVGWLRKLSVHRYLDLDGTWPKRQARALIKRVDNDRVVNTWRPSSNGVIGFQANTEQKLYMFSMWYSEVQGGYDSEFVDVFSIQLEKNDRYLSMRGNR